MITRTVKVASKPKTKNAERANSKETPDTAADRGTTLAGEAMEECIRSLGDLRVYLDEVLGEYSINIEWFAIVVALCSMPFWTIAALP